MRIEETSDGMVKVVELDPTKMYWLLINEASGISAEQIRKRDGLIIFHRPMTSGEQVITFVENSDRVVVPE